MHFALISRFPRFATLTFATLALFVGGCTIPTSEHPLSDEKTSVLDERLFGHWDFKREDASDVDPMRFVVGRDPKSENVLEYVAPNLDGQQKIEIHRGRLFVTKIAEDHYLSFDNADPNQGYLIMRYEFKPHTADAQGAGDQNANGHDKLNRDTVEFHLMVDTVFADAINKGELAGKVTVEKSSGRLQEIRITAKPDELKAFIEKNAARCFTPDAVKMVRMNSL